MVGENRRLNSLVAINAEAGKRAFQGGKSTQCMVRALLNGLCVRWDEGAAYVEEDEAMPLSVYGSTKLEAKQTLHEHHSAYLIFRTSWVYGVYGNFSKAMPRFIANRFASSFFCI